MISTRRRSARLALAAARKAVVRQRGAPPLRRQRITRLSSGVPRRDIGAAPSAAQVARPDGQARALPCGGELVAGVPAPVRHGDDLGRRRFACHPAVERGLLPPGREARGLFEPGDLVPHDVEPVVADNAPRVAGVLVPAPWRVWRGEGVDEVKRVGKLGEKR